jgi:Putative transposase
MTLDTHEFIRRFLMHLLPQGSHRIRYYCMRTIRVLVAVPLITTDAIKAATTKPEELQAPEHPCLLRQPYAHHRGLLAGAQLRSAARIG